jgi:hypothetical protein
MLLLRILILDGNEFNRTSRLKNGAKLQLLIGEGSQGMKAVIF